MTTYIDTKIITLTSQSATIKRNDTYLSNVRYELGLMLKDDKDIIHRQIQLLNAQIPYSFYVINYTNNLLKYNLSSVVTTTIPVGNYTANSLITAIKTAIGNVNLTITISAINGKLTFTHTTLPITIYNDFKYSIGSILGFPTNSINVANVSNVLVADYPLNLLGIKVLQVRSGNLSMNNISSVQGGHTTLLSSIPVSAVPFGMIEYNDVGNNLITITNTTLDDLDIDIVDGESGEYINFNNQDWCITLALHIHRLFQPSLENIQPSLENKTLPNQPLRKVQGERGFAEPNILQKGGVIGAKSFSSALEPSVPLNNPALDELNFLAN